MNSIFDPFTLGSMELSNRIVMAPMTRARASDDGVPTSLMKQYYAQRASAGLIISEGVYPSIDGKGYFATPGIETEDQISGWKDITDAVHAKGGRIYLQLMHCGRVGHPNNNGGIGGVAPSEIQAAFDIITRQEGMVRMAKPRALASEEVDDVLDRFEQAARNTKAAGFDGIELHAASGYLPMQFLSTGTNLRRDKWGGTPEKRTRFAIEAMERLAKVFGEDRTGIKIAPGISYNDIADETVEETYGLLLDRLEAMKPAYVHFQTTLSYEHLAEFSEVGKTEGKEEVWHNWPFEFVRQRFSGIVMAAGDLTAQRAQDVLNADMADLFVFGRRYISNPDLPERMQADHSLNDPNLMTFYGGGAEGYTDYPTMAGA